MKLRLLIAAVAALLASGCADKSMTLEERLATRPGRHTVQYRGRYNVQ